MANTDVTLVLGYRDGQTTEISGLAPEDAEAALQGIYDKMFGGGHDQRVMVPGKLVIWAGDLRCAYLQTAATARQA